MSGKGITPLPHQAGYAILSVDGLFFEKFIRLYRRAALHKQHHRYGYQRQQNAQPQPGGKILADVKQVILAQSAQRQQ